MYVYSVNHSSVNYSNLCLVSLLPVFPLVKFSSRLFARFSESTGLNPDLVWPSRSPQSSWTLAFQPHSLTTLPLDFNPPGEPSSQNMWCICVSWPLHTAPAACSARPPLRWLQQLDAPFRTQPWRHLSGEAHSLEQREDIVWYHDRGTCHPPPRLVVGSYFLSQNVRPTISKPFFFYLYSSSCS